MTLKAECPSPSAGLDAAIAATLQSVTKLRGGVERGLRDLGFTVMLPDESHLCCGSAGTYSVLQPALSHQLRDRKLEHLSTLKPEAIASVPELAALGRPLLLGPSRKSFIGRVLDLPAGERVFGTAAAVAACVLGGAHIVRVHDVGPMTQVARVCDAILAAGPEAGRQSA